MTIEKLWKDYEKYRYMFWKKDVSRSTARQITSIPRCGYEIVVDIRISNGHKQTMYLQNISNAVFRFWVYTDPCMYHAPEVSRA